MPELPEVETIKRDLKNILIGRRITSVDVRVKKLFIGKVNEIVNKKIADVERRAKLIIIKLTTNYLVIHLKMTGQLIFESDLQAKKIITGGHPDKLYVQPPPNKYTHIIIKFDKGTLYFNDLRKFGWMKVLKDENQLKEEVQNYGPEYDWPEFSFDYWYKTLKSKPNSTIKQTLLDQKVIAGLGNIYSDEVLFLAKIKPNRKNHDITRIKAEVIYRTIPEVIKLALRHEGTSARDYRKVDGSTGTFLSVANVYKREGQPCKVCGEIIQKVKVGSRTSRYCPNCQR